MAQPGINPEDLSMIRIKAAVGHRRAYDKIARPASPSAPGALHLGLPLPYQRLRRRYFLMPRWVTLARLAADA